MKKRKAKKNIKPVFNEIRADIELLKRINAQEKAREDAFIRLLADIEPTQKNHA